MQLILTQPIPSLGKRHDIINVKDGYALNYLLPKKLAIVATPKEIARVQQRKQNEIKTKEEVVAQAQDIKAKIDSLEKIELKRKATSSGKLFAAVSEKDIGEALKELLKIDVDRKSISLSSPSIKSLGEYEAFVQLTPNVQGKVKVVVGNEE